MRSSGAFSFHAGWSAVVFSAIGATVSAQDAPAFRFQPQLRPLAAQPRANRYVAGAEASLPVAPAGVARTPSRRRDEFYIPLALRRQRQRNFALASARDIFTFRAPGGLSAQLSLGLQSEFRATDNFNSAPAALALSEEIFEFTPIARLNVGGLPGLQPERSPEPEYYLDALYAPTSHHLLRAGQSAFLQQLLAFAGRATHVAHTGVRIAYDENIFAAAGDSSAEESYTLLEVGPVLDYRLSAKTAVHVRGDYRRITRDNPTPNRSELTGDARIDCELSVKTTAGLGVAAGHIRFHQALFGTQDYGQAFVTLVWKATPKVTFRTQVGVELRQFTRPLPKAAGFAPVAAAPPKPDSIAPVAVTVLEWRASEKTRVAAAFRVERQPSVEQGGALFRETKLGIEAQHDIAASFYARGELEFARRAYDSGRLETELTLRPAMGYQLTSGAIFDSAKLEVFYQFRHHWNQGVGGDYVRNQAGLQLTVFF